MLFKKKIVFTEGMNETLCSFDEIPWFSCCGVPAVSVFSGFTILMLLVSVFIILLFIWLIFIQVINVHSGIQK